MKKNTVVLLIEFIIIFYVSIGYGAVNVNVFDGTFLRRTGEPVTESRIFFGVGKNATIKIINGSLEDTAIEKVSSSEISINGQVIFTPSEFNQKVSQLEKTVPLSEGKNNLEIILKGKPGGQLRIQITQTTDMAGGTVYGRVADTNGNSISGATVQIGIKGVTVKTASDGSYAAEFGPGEIGAEPMLVVSTAPNGYSSAQAKVIVNLNDTVYPANLFVKAVDATVVVTDPSENVAEVSTQEASLKIPAGSVRDDTGQLVSKPLTVNMTVLNPSDPSERAAFPGGDFLAINPNAPTSEPINLESVALVEVSLFGESGAKYSVLAQPATIAIKLPANEQSKYRQGDTIPLWYYDEDMGIWKREGESTVIDKDGTLWITAQVSHFTWWNADWPITTHGCLAMTPKNGSGNLMTNLGWQAQGVSYNGDSQGNVSGEKVYFNVKRSSSSTATERVRFYAIGVNQYLVWSGGTQYALVDSSTQATPFAAPTVQASFPSDSAGCVDLGTVIIAPERPPVVALSPNIAHIDAGATLNISAVVSDPDGDLDLAAYTWGNDCSGTFSATSLAAATFIAPSTATVCHISLTAHDQQGLSSIGTAVIDVAGAIEPLTVSNPLSDQTTGIGQPFSYILQTDFATGGTPPYTFSAMDVLGGPIPPWLYFDTTNLRFDGWPWSSSDAGTYEIRVTVCDQNLECVSDNFTITVNPSPPLAISVPLTDQIAHVNELFAYSLPENFVTGGVSPYSFSAGDSGGGVYLPSWLYFDSWSRSFQGVPSDQDQGDYDILVRACDQNLECVSDQFHLAVKVEGACTGTATAVVGLNCWGSNLQGELGNGETHQYQNPLLVAVTDMGGVVDKVVASWASSCALKDGRVACWGANFFGQLGIGNWDESAVPVQPIGLSTGVTALEGSYGHFCALQNGTLRCWGDNNSGQIGNGLTGNQTTPDAVINMNNGVTVFNAMGQHTCAVKDGALYCWGENYQGQLGIGTSGWGSSQKTPVPVPGFESGVTKVAGGLWYTCVIKDGGVWCWGENEFGQLGIGQTGGIYSTPQPVQGMQNGVTDLTAGMHHTCALSNGGLYCWGYNEFGELGDGTTTTRPSPVLVSGMGSGVTALDAGGFHTCAVQSGALKCWGENSQGQLGDCSVNRQTTPVQVLGLEGGVGSIAAGNYYSCAVYTP